MAGVLLLAAVAAIYSLSLTMLRRAGRTASPWWFGYARDLDNLVAVLLFSGAFAIAGLPGHLALLAGAAIALFGYLLDWFLARHLGLRQAPVMHGVSLVVLSSVAGLAARPIERGLGALLEGLF